MMERSLSILALLLAFAVMPVRGQELDCAVSVDYSRLSAGTDYSFLGELEDRISEYVNAHAWTEDTYRAYERIDCTISIYFQEALSLSEFNARLVVASRRPIYGTMNATPVVRFSDDDWTFEYRRGKPLIHDVTQFDALTSVLDFYVYVLLGYDYDTFSELGGTPYFEQARRIVELAQAAGATGWAQLGDDRSREALVNQLLDPRYQPLRRASFQYHFRGLDRFTTETEAARQAILEALRTIAEVDQNVSRRYAIDLFFGAKYQELAAIFDGAPRRTQVYDLLTRLDPAHLTEYDQLVQ